MAQNSVRKVDHSALRTNQAFIIGTLLAAFIASSWILVASMTGSSTASCPSVRQQASLPRTLTVNASSSTKSVTLDRRNRLPFGLSRPSRSAARLQRRSARRTLSHAWCQAARSSRREAK